MHTFLGASSGTAFVTSIKVSALRPPPSADSGGATLLHPRLPPALHHKVGGVKGLRSQAVGLRHHEHAGVGQLRQAAAVPGRRTGRSVGG